MDGAEEQQQHHGADAKQGCPEVGRRSNRCCREPCVRGERQNGMK